MEELDLKELLSLFWGKKMQIILITAIFCTIGIIYSLGFVTPKYEATSTLLLATNSSPESQTTPESITTTDVTINSKLVSTYRELVTSKKVIRQVISTLGIDESEDSIKNNVTVSARTDTEVIEIKVRNEDPVLATKITNEIAKIFIENVKEYYGMENVHIVDEAEIPETPCNINYTKTVAVFIMMGLIISVIYILICNMLDTTLKSEEDVEKIEGLTVLASIPLYGTATQKGKNKRGGRK